MLSAAYPQRTHRADFSGYASVQMGLLRNRSQGRDSLPARSAAALLLLASPLVNPEAAGR
jgi:hypothetical protein